MIFTVIDTTYKLLRYAVSMCSRSSSHACSILFSLYLQFPPEPFSFLNVNTDVKQIDNLISCASTYTNAETHKIVLEEAHQLPEEAKDGVGPRYCPSIYKKCQRFPDRPRHLSWLEPEGLNTNMVYPNGMSGPYPEDIQLKIFRTMKVYFTNSVSLPFVCLVDIIVFHVPYFIKLKWVV